jgi:NADPH:quinone reductase-like Zn-dependent oxidoreductase
LQSLSIAFTGTNQVELLSVPVQEPGPGEVLIQTSKTLISTGTESIALGRLFEPDSHWARWVSSYPFFPGYSMIGRVIAVGSGVENVKEGDRVGA